MKYVSHIRTKVPFSQRRRVDGSLYLRSVGPPYVYYCYSVGDRVMSVVTYPFAGLAMALKI